MVLDQDRLSERILSLTCPEIPMSEIRTRSIRTVELMPDLLHQDREGRVATMDMNFAVKAAKAAVDTPRLPCKIRMPTRITASSALQLEAQVIMAVLNLNA